jgi:hypothetical protein
MIAMYVVVLIFDRESFRQDHQPEPELNRPHPISTQRHEIIARPKEQYQASMRRCKNGIGLDWIVGKQVEEA